MGASDGRERASVSGKCPACGSGGLFVGSGGYLTCPWAECPNPGAPHDALVKAPEPPSDGYVSRNVYDYDEPEPPADERAALVRVMRDRDDMFVTFEMHAGAILAALPGLGYIRIDPTDEAQVEKVAKAVKPLFSQAGLVDLDADDYSWDAARAVLAALLPGGEA